MNEPDGAPEAPPPSKRRRWTGRTAAGAYAVAALVMFAGAAIGDTVLGEDDDPIVPPAAPRIAPPSDPSAPTAGKSDVTITTLSDAQRKRATALVASDAELKQVLGDTGYQVEKSGPWTAGREGSPSRLLGAAFVLRLDRPIELRDVTLPVAYYDRREERVRPYQLTVNRVSADKVKRIDVLVDFGRGALASVQPDPDSAGLRTSAVKGFERTVPQPQRGR